MFPSAPSRVPDVMATRSTTEDVRTRLGASPVAASWRAEVRRFGGGLDGLRRVARLAGVTVDELRRAIESEPAEVR